MKRKFKKEEIECIIDSYFKDTKHVSEVKMCGDCADIVIHYTDFKSARDVRRYVDDNVPNADSISVIRDFSGKAVSLAINIIEESKKRLFIVNDETGAMEELSLRSLLRMALYDKEIVL